MRKNNIRVTTLAFVIPILLLLPAGARAQAAKASYTVMAPLDQYLIPEAIRPRLLQVHDAIRAEVIEQTRARRTMQRMGTTTAAQMASASLAEPGAMMKPTPATSFIMSQF
jgi:hypothetical protein